MTMAADKQDKVLNVPTLRFPEFTDEWDKDRVHNLFTMNVGGDIDKANVSSIQTDEFKYPVIANALSNDGIYGYTSEYKDDSPSITVTGRGDVGLAKYRDYPLFPIVRLLVLHSKGKIDCRFGEHAINCIKKYEESTGVPQLTAPQLGAYSISFPNLTEQAKIGAFLKLIDDRISTQIRIIEDLRSLKAYIHDRVFSKGNTLFGQRITIRLSEIATKITRKNKGNTINNVLSNSAAMGIVPQSEVFDKEIANENNTANYYVIGNGDFVYNPRKSAQAPFGPINMYTGQVEGIISPLYLCFQVEDINKNYLLHYFMSNVWYSYIYSNGDTGVRHDRVSIKDETFLDMPLYIHTIDKQQEIAKMMDQVDAKIVLEESYLTKLQKQKDYLLAAMFV
mgnify:CR=1 FL=1